MTEAGGLLEPGRNCWRIEHASRVGMVVDADAYFRAARAAMLKAERQILLIGWEFDARIKLVMDEEDEGPTEVGAFLSWLVKRKPELNIYLLRWDYGAMKAFLHLRTLVRLISWQFGGRIHPRLDTLHPPTASHHQKIVVIDDCLAFCGGIDMTRDRWDTREHLDHLPNRLEPDGTPYGPWHDATCALSGPAAKALGELCRQRWARSGGGTLPSIDSVHDCWPEHLPVTLKNAEVAISRSRPKWKKEEAHLEIEHLYLDLIASARRFIYAESQYFASRRIAEAIAARLAEPDGPEFVILNPLSAQGWLEPIAMDSARARLVEAMNGRDPHKRLRLYHPYTAGGEPIYVHAKIMVVDDQVLRVGSSNFNNRSLRLDSECDVTIDAGCPANDHAGPAIAAIRNDLLAEHLGTSAEEVAETFARTGSLIATVETLRRAPGRTLRPYEVPDLAAVTTWLADNKILDPEGPEEMFEAISRRSGLLDRLRRRRGARRAR